MGRGAKAPGAAGGSWPSASFDTTRPATIMLTVVCFAENASKRSTSPSQARISETRYWSPIAFVVVDGGEDGARFALRCVP